MPYLFIFPQNLLTIIQNMAVFPKNKLFEILVLSRAILFRGL